LNEPHFELIQRLDKLVFGIDLRPLALGQQAIVGQLLPMFGNCNSLRRFLSTCRCLRHFMADAQQ
jgi:hypothetical protein